MLWKLSLTGIKSRFKDYLVLFSGLTFAKCDLLYVHDSSYKPSFLKGFTKHCF